MRNLSKSGKIFFCGTIVSVLVCILSAIMFIISIIEAGANTDLGYDLGDRNVVKLAIGEDGTRVAGTQEGELFAFTDEGELLWETGKLRSSAVYDISVKEGKVAVVYADGSVLLFSMEDAAENAAEQGAENPALLSLAKSWKIDFSISGNVTNTQLLVAGEDIYLRAKCNDGSNRNYIFRLPEGGTPVEVRKPTSFSLGGMAYYEGDLYYAFRTQLYCGEESLFELDEDICAVSAGENISMITESGKLLVYEPESGEWLAEVDLGVRLDTGYIFSTGENFLAKIKNGGVALIDTEERAVTLEMAADNNANFILWNDEYFMLRDTTDVNNPVVIFYAVEQARMKSLFSALRWVFLALFVVAAAAAIICAVCITHARRAKFTAGVVRTAKAIWRDKSIYLSLLIPFALLITFFYIPIVLGFSISFMDYVPGEKAVFEGFKYFGMVARSETFWSASGTMALFLIADILKALIPPFIIAELLITVRLKRFSLWIRILLFIPGILPGVAATLVWQEGIFGATTNSLMNAFIHLFSPTFTQMNWIYNPSFIVRVLTVVCFGFPWVGSYLIFFGALGGINTSIFEAAKLDGCSWFRRVFTIDIPLILSQFKYVLITTFIASVQNYGTLYILYQDGSGDTLRTPALMMYREIMSSHYSIASVYGVFLFIFLAVVTVLNFRSQREQIE